MIHKGKTAGTIGIIVVAIMMILAGGIACKKAPQPGEKTEAAAAPGEAATMIKEGVNELAGTVKSALGKYFYISQHPGFDFVAEGPVDNADAAALLNKEVKVKAVFNRETPSLLIAQSIDIKESETQFKNVFSKAETAVPADYFSQKVRPEYAALKISNINKSEDWEGKGKGKVEGKPIAGADGKITGISILGNDGKEIGKVIVDGTSEFATYYIKKLRLFDSFWFYLNIKDSVAKNLRPKNKELFHADVVFTGLY
ncbi:MAG: hypothetical protein Q8O91_05905 [Candidatus Aminicenantes bacterium]|nr:hypothetical protein [Candidatus Aminicenantes bacterium]